MALRAKQPPAPGKADCGLALAKELLVKVGV
jgi:hypothetical protein